MIFPEIGNIVNPYRNSPTSVGDIIRDVCVKNNITLAQLKGETRVSKVCQARWEAWSRIHEELGFSSRQIARRFNRDCSTVRHGLRKNAS